MKTKREEARRTSGRRSGRDGAARTGRRPRPGTTTEVGGARRGRGTAAPNREARVPSSGPQTNPISRPVDRPARPKNTSQAKARAKARKAKAPKVVRPKLSERLATRLATIDLRPRTLISKVPFVVLVIGSLGVGLGLTLWLSTAAAERSYHLSDARERTRMLQQQKESLERDVRQAESAPALAEAARKQGMIPTRDTAHLVQAPDGNWVVVGTPKPADGVPPPPLNTKLPEEGPPPPPKPPVAPPEVPVRVMPGPNDPPPPGRAGPQLLPRNPDGSTTLGGAQPFPGQLPGQLPGQQPGQLTVPQVVPPVPGQPVPGPAEVPLPLQAGAMPPGLVMPPVLAPVAPVPALAPAPVPPTGEQFGPVTVPVVPGAQR
ncbi:hypothetical protein A5725_00780 [Mycobacterium kubicae]|uniref:hypothetical protein n=1 Tax=Mycobacterium kubicae TaxID=120959 RepID=UPI0008024F86|nr:hypothetical protein [Mycobacterium kubicae]OBF21309.1 hypothetical protein A5725_00780 [Mycobacterium kubicae]